MFCKKCGAQIPDESKFCTTCGAEITSKAAPTEAVEAPTEAVEAPVEVVETPKEETEAVVVEEATTVAVEEPIVVEAPVIEEQAISFEPQETPRKKKVLPKILAIVLAVAVLLGAAVFVFKDRMTGIVMSLMPAEKQLKYTYTRFAENLSNNFAEDYAIALEKIGKPYSGEVTLDAEVSEDLISELVGDIDLSVNKASVVYQLQNSGENLTGLDFGIKVGETLLANFEAYADLENKELILAVPEIIDGAVKLDLEELMDEDDLEQFKTIQSLSSSENLKKLLPKEELVKTILPKVVKAALAEVEDVEKGKSEFKAGDVTQKANCLEIEITYEVLAKMAIGALEEIKENEDVKEYIEQAAALLEEYSDELVDNGYDFDDLYDDAIDAIDEIIEELYDVDEDEELCTLKTWINSKFDIIAIEVEIPDEEATIFAGMANDGKEWGYEVSVSFEEEEVFLLTGNLELEKDKLSGSFDIGYEDEHLATIEVKDLDALKLRDGYLSGKAIVLFGAEINEEIENETGIARPVILIEFETEKEKVSYTVTVSSENETLFSVGMKVAVSEGADIDIPESTTTDIEEWVQNIDTEEILDRLSKIGFTEDMLSSIVGEVMGSDEDYDDSYDDYDDDYVDYMPAPTDVEDMYSY